MGAITAIEWTDHTFNPWIGCTKVSPGCKHCYAETLDRNRFSKTLGGASTAAPVSHWGPGAPRYRTASSNWTQPLKWQAVFQKAQEKHLEYFRAECGAYDGAVWTPLSAPRVFCASLADWLDPEVPIEWLADLLALIHATPHLNWQLLTKRPELWKKRVMGAAVAAANRGEVASSLIDWMAGTPPANVWIGTSVEDQERADERIPHLLQIPARIHFLSCEPLLGPLLIPLHQWQGIQWCIAGGESGPGARYMAPGWAESLRDQCQLAGTAYFFKQHGGTNKKAAGRVLGGRLWSEFPASS